MSLIAKIKQAAKDATYKPGASTDEAARFQYFTLFLLVGIPIMVVFGVTNYLQGVYNITVIAVACALGLTTGWLLIKYTDRDMAVYRANAVIYMSLLIYLLYFGGEGGSKILWLYTFPLIVFFLFGRVEGAVWSSILVLAVLLLFYSWLNRFLYHAYQDEFKVRFVASFITVNAVTFCLEYLRFHYKQRLEVQNAALEKEINYRKTAELEKQEIIDQLQTALDEVKELSGLLPICSSCKKVRGDSGYWQKIESYISEHSAAEFSHSICPDCSDELYGEEGWYTKKTTGDRDRKQ